MREELVRGGEVWENPRDVAQRFWRGEQLRHGVEPRGDRVEVGRRLDERGAQEARARARLAVVEHAEQGELRVAGAAVAQHLEVGDRGGVEEHRAVDVRVPDAQRALDELHGERVLGGGDERGEGGEPEVLRRDVELEGGELGAVGVVPQFLEAVEVVPLLAQRVVDARVRELGARDALEHRALGGGREEEVPRLVPVEDAERLRVRLRGARADG